MDARVNAQFSHLQKCVRMSKPVKSDLDLQRCHEIVDPFIDHQACCEQ